MARILIALGLFGLLAGCGGASSAGPVDGGAQDAGSPGRFDGGEPDAGPDAGAAPDAGEPDAGPLDAGAAFIVAVVSFDAGANAGFGQNRMPRVVEGPPVGGGNASGSTDVLSLGVGGQVVVELGEEIVDLPGPDFTVFENAFQYAGGIYAEPGAVAVSDDGVSFTEFPCDPDAGVVATCAGMHPVYSNPNNGLSPLDPSVSGGDPLDLADLGVTRARYVRIRDLGLGGTAAPTAGFDLDAIAVVHGL